MNATSEAEWYAGNSAWDMFGRFSFEVTSRKFRLFAVACCRCSRQLLLNADHKQAVDLAEQFADGLATKKELSAANRRTNELVSELRPKTTEREIRRWAEAVAVLVATAPECGRIQASEAGFNIARAAGHRHQDVDLKMAVFLRDVIGNPFRPMSRVRPPNPPWLTPKILEAIPAWPEFEDRWFNPAWLTSDVLALARGIYDDRAFDWMPILADALQDAGCTNDDILNHCRDANQVHVRGCWAVDLVLGKV